MSRLPGRCAHSAGQLRAMVAGETLQLWLLLGGPVCAGGVCWALPQLRSTTCGEHGVTGLCKGRARPDKCVQPPESFRHFVRKMHLAVGMYFLPVFGISSAAWAGKSWKAQMLYEDMFSSRQKNTLSRGSRLRPGSGAWPACAWVDGSYHGVGLTAGGGGQRWLILSAWGASGSPHWCP